MRATPQRLLLALAGLALLASSCAGPQGYRLQGQVVEDRTGKPLAGAWVVGAWIGVGLWGGLWVRAREAQTDAQGRFDLGAPGGLHEESVTVYAPGYLAWNTGRDLRTGRARDGGELPPVIRLEPFPPDARWEEHVRLLRQAIWAETATGERLYDPAAELPGLTGALARDRRGR